MNSAPQLKFDEANHVYTFNGAVVPGVTTVLHDLAMKAYYGVDPEVMARAALLGTAVHKVIELDIRGVLDLDALDPQLLPYYRAWRNFLALSGFEPLLSEARVHSLRYGFAGTLDLFGTLNSDAALVDAKRTVVVPRSAGPQTAAYEIALRETYPDIVKRAASGPGEGRIERYALHLKADSKWQLVPFRERRDPRVFLAALTTHLWSKAA